MPTQLSADAMLVISQWRGRPDAALHVIHDVCVPAGRIADRTMILAVEEVREAGLTDVVWDGHVLTDAGREVLADMEAPLPSAPGGVPGGLREPAGEPFE